MTPADGQDARLTAQFTFLNEADRLKSVLRATTLCDGSRRENSGEHSWHLALYAMVLTDQSAPGVDQPRDPHAADPILRRRIRRALHWPCWPSRCKA